mmetsp:Transcript_8305/g.13417  ORF Transcript_8305/g.13417 Transcript_8305/m.13417 type:complete len:304 (+) Transcript_8305:1-912(+)
MKSSQNPNRSEASDIETEAEEVMRRFSEVSSTFGLPELNLRQDYENAINCVVQCESMINTLQEQLASKDEQIASLEEKIMRIPSEPLQEQLVSKDEQITSLEGKIVQMSLELASTKASEGELQHRLKTSFTSASSNASNEVSGISSQASVASNEARYRPTSTSTRRKNLAGHRMGSSWRSTENQSLVDSAKTSSISGMSFTTATSANTSAKTSFSSINSGRQGWTLDDSNSGRLSSFGQFFLKNRGLKDCQEVQDGEKKEKEKTNIDVEHLRRRPPNSRRMERQKKLEVISRSDGGYFSSILI